MKKTIAIVLALALTVGFTACGISDKEDTSSTTTTAANPSTSSTTTTTATVATSVVVGTDADGSTVTSVVEITATTTTTTVYVPSGATVPIGTKPSTTVTQAPTTTTTTATAPSVDEPVGSTTTTAATTTTATTTTVTTTVDTTTTTAKPTEPEPLYIVLPAIGTDIDVTNKRDRIRVSQAAAWLNDDSTIGVSLTFKNYSSNWITEETNYVQYTCYDKNGNVVQKETKLMIGCIDTKKNVEKTFTFDVPANTAEVRLTGSKIVYWTEWS